MNFIKLFSKPKIIAIIGDVNTGKSMLIYWLLKELKKIGKFKLYTYGLRVNMSNSKEIYSVGELESIKNSIVILDEVMSLWDLDNRASKRQIEKTLRLIFHNNNILLICGVPENFKKFISGKLNAVFYKKVTFQDFVNGSKAKYMITDYKGEEMGSSILNIEPNEVILFDSKHYSKLIIPYLRNYDTKKNNPEIVRKK